MPAEASAAGSLQLVRYLGVLRRRKWTVVVVTILAFATALGFSKSETPTYDASSEVLLQNSSSPLTELLGTGSPFQPNITDEIQRLQSPSVAVIVRTQLGTAPPVSGSSIAGSDIMVISASSTSASEAARVVNAYAGAYIEQRQAAEVSSYLSAAKVVQGEINTLNGQIAALNSQAVGSPAAPKPQVAALSSQIGLLQEEATTLQTESSIGATGVQLLQPAIAPSSPSTPKTLRNGLLGLGGGLVLGIALAFLRESLDDTITSKDDLDRTQPGLPVLGIIPAMSGRTGGIKDLIADTRPHSAAAEAYRSLRTSVQFLTLDTLDRPIRILQVTSPRTFEGKTTTVANLAVTLAAAGQRVIVVDCDLRRPRQHDVFRLPNEVGLTSVLLGDAPMSDALQAVPEHKDLFLLSSGERSVNPAELLSGPRTREVFAVLERMADVVLVDCPPVLPVTDAVLISGRVDATFLVVSAGLTSAKDLARALEVLGQVDAPVSGFVLNAVTVNTEYRYRYQYPYSPAPAHLPGGEQT
jgi:succinoglycan biosynthesis transport protein ExoP